MVQDSSLANVLYIDLSNNKIFYTEEFENFLNYRQLEVTAVYTPAHTAIRLFKKLDELNCYCDIEGSMKISHVL